MEFYDVFLCRMIAFTIFGRPIYRYGMSYAITFLSGYIFLWFVTQQGYIYAFPKIHAYLKNSLDDFVSLIILALLLGGRLGHVFFYERAYYSTHLDKILAVHDGGMAFLGGVVGVILMLIYIQVKNRFSRVDICVLGDLILCIVPLGIFLGRIANFLNQEMVGKAIETFPIWFQQIAGFLGLIHIYTLVDLISRFNINITQAVLEGLIPLIIGGVLFWSIYMRHAKGFIPHPNPLPSGGTKVPTIHSASLHSLGEGVGRITTVFFIRYGMVRFLEEYTKDVGIHEYIYGLTVSQWLALLLMVAGIYIYARSKRAPFIH